MKDQEKMDQWLRDQMKDFRPVLTESSKDRFISGVYGKNRTDINTKLVISIFIALLFPLAAMLLFKTNNNEIPSVPVKSIPSPNKSGSEDIPILKKIIEPNFNPENIKPQIKPILISDHYQQNEELIRMEEMESEELISNEENKALKPFYNKSEQSIRTDSAINEAYVSDTITNEKLQDREQGFKREPYLWNTSLSIYYRPEMLYNVIGNEKLLQNFGIEYNKRLFNGNYIVGTGIGITLTRGHYEYAIDYNEFLGNYQRLDSITFNWEPASFSMQQTLHTSEERVFDSKISTDYARVERKFIYLQVPLILGYDFYNNHRWSAGVRVNPVLSLLLSRKPVDFRYETGENRLIQINRITPDRVKANWQLAAGITVSRRLSDNLWIELEPSFAYYFNSVYEKPVISESPWGVSLKIALGLRY